MSYLVLARKYRPKTFSEMVGQEHVVQALTNALTSGRLHHAYLFTGTRGVGKTTVSRILAKSLNCQGPDGQGGVTAAPCGVCQACRDIDAGRFVDYTELDAASNRGVDEVQALLEQAVYKPVAGRYKVFMIDEVHMLTGHAFNAMLKTLEEPPEYLKFVLATTDPQKVPVTVLSRCLQFNLRPMAPETMMEHLAQVLSAERVEAEPQALRLLARAARGSMRDALSLTDQAIAFGNGTLQEAGVRQMLGSADRGHVFGLIEALAQGDGLTVVETSEALRRDGLAAASTLEEMTAVLQAMAVLQAVPARAGAALAGASDPDAAETARLAALMPPDETHLLYSICLHGRAELGLAPDEYAGLTMVLLRLLAFKPGGADVASADDSRLSRKTAHTAGTPDGRADSSGARTGGAPAIHAQARGQAPVPGPRQPHEPRPAGEPGPAPSAAPRTAPVAHEASAHAIAAQGAVVPQALAQGVSRDGAMAHGPAAQDVAAQRPAVSGGPPAAGVSALDERSGLVAPATVPRHNNHSPARAEAAPGATNMVALPLRVPPPPGPREAPREPDAASAAVALVSGGEGDFWHGVVSRLVAAEAIAALARELALQSQLVARDVGQWLLRVERESLNSAGSRERLQTALATLGHEVRLVVEIGAVQDSPARRNALAASERQRAAEEAIRSDPLVQAMMRDFDARIVPGSLRPE